LTQKKSREARLLKSLNREASNRVDEATRNPDDWTLQLSLVKLKKWLTASGKLPRKARFGALFACPCQSESRMLTA